MAWQRKIPFGYQMRGGVIECHPREASAVQNIFTQYLAGASYLAIAKEMVRQGVHYHQRTAEWNKNMVKRILENGKYLGMDPYPRIVQDEDFYAARLLRTDKNTYALCPAQVEPVRGKVVCGVCGARMVRDTKSHGQRRWRCQGPECGQVVRIEDEALYEMVYQRLRDLVEDLELLTPTPTPQVEMSADARRIQNELNLALNRSAGDVEYIKMLAFAAATEQYAALPDPTPGHKLEALKERLKSGGIDTDILNDLLKSAVQAIRIISNQEIEFLLVNNRVLKCKGKEVSNL